jgi:hypothetical protein
MGDKIRIYWWRGFPNVGDYYSKWLISHILDENSSEYSDYPDLICCGSILSYNGLQPTTKVCGAGFHNEDSPILINNIDNYHAVRGVLSYKKLNTTKQITLGDSGLLASRFYTPKAEKKHRYGIVCHWKEYNYLNNIYGNSFNLINMGTTDVEDIFEKLSECEMIFSTSLHGIIFAHSFGIPATHLEYQELESKNNFKFKDYYSVLDIPYEKYVLKSNDDLKELDIMFNKKEQYLPSRIVIENIQDNLLKSFSTVVEVVKRDNKRFNAVICAIAKNENYYINNWCRYHLNIGFSKIYLFDNNELSTPYVGDFIDSDIKDRVQIIDKRGIHKQALQLDCYNQFYKEYSNMFDWCAFIDADEFVSGVKDVGLWLADKRYNDFEMIRLKWKLFGDDNVIERDLSIPVQNFFKNVITNNTISNQGKAIVRGKLSDVNVGSCHYAFRGHEYVDGVIGDKSNIVMLSQCFPSGSVSNSRITIAEDYSKETIFLNHYMTKTLSEFITQKYNRGDAVFEDRSIDFSYFWRVNTKTKEKLDYINKFMSGREPLPATKILPVKNAIDIVVPYVDSSDKNWQTLFNHYSPKEINEHSNGKQRFRNNDLFKYWFRSVEQYAPWINNVFLLVQSASQVPSWMSRSEKLKIITHDQFIPVEYLPLFNSQTIEMFLHKIPGLSERFIYSNDDIYFIGPLKPEDYFTSKGVRTDFNVASVGDRNTMPVWKSSIINSNLLVNREETEKLLDQGLYLTPMHVARPYLKSKLEEVHKLYGTEIANSISRFRETKNLTVYLYDFYIKKEGLVLSKSYNHHHFSNKTSLYIIGNAMANPDTNSIMCLNDTAETIDKSWERQITQKFVEKYPKKSQYEV